MILIHNVQMMFVNDYFKYLNINYKNLINISVYCY